MKNECSSEPIKLEDNVIKECLPQNLNYFDYFPFKFDKLIKQKNIRLIELCLYRKTQFNLKDRITYFTLRNFNKMIMDKGRCELMKSSRKIILPEGYAVWDTRNEWFKIVFGLDLLKNYKLLQATVKVFTCSKYITINFVKKCVIPIDLHQ